MAFNLYAVKQLFEDLFPLGDLVLQLTIFIIFLCDILKKIKYNQKLKYEKYLVFFAFLIMINGFYNGIIEALYIKEYIQAILNYGFIFIICIYILNAVNTRNELISILRMTRFNIILVTLFSLYDTKILGISRAGDTINPNYLSQMAVILLLFFIFSSEKKLSLQSLFYYGLSIYSIFLTGSKSGLMAIIIIICSILLFSIKSKKIVVFSYYAFWGLFLFYIGIILSTANYNYGLLKFFVKEEDTSRIALWQYTFTEFLKHPFMGDLYNTFRVPWGTIELVTHNDYLRLAVELGVISVILLFVFGRKQIKLLENYNKWDSMFLYALIMVTLSYSLSHNNLNNPMFWLALVLPSLKIFSPQHLKKEKGVEKNY